MTFFVTDQVKKILILCSEAKSRREILSLMGLTNHFDNYHKHIEPLLSDNLLEMTIPDKPKSGNQKYRITEKGKELLNRK